MDSNAANVYKQINDVGEVAALLAPLTALPWQSRVELHCSGYKNALAKGAYKQKVLLTFDVADISRICVPTLQCLNIVATAFDIIWLVRHQAVGGRYDLYIVAQGFVRTALFDKAAKAFVDNLCTDKSYVKTVQFHKLNGQIGGSKKTHNNTRNSMWMSTGYNMQLQLIDMCRIDTKATKNESVEQQVDECKQVQSQILVQSNGKVFDVQKFGSFCINILENLMVFTTNDSIRALQLQANVEQQIRTLRLIDHRPLIQELWRETINFALDQPGLELVKERFTQEQISVLYNANYPAIMNTFNQFAIGGGKMIVQPHPVRALLECLPYLIVSNTFDMSRYNFRQYGLNWILTSFYFGKNFLSLDHTLTNNHGAICFSGAPGSGKSRISQILQQFLHGFNFQDSPRGITEFQNADIVSTSFIRSEEVDIRRLVHADWKLLSDIEMSIKCRIKHQPDVEVTKFVPVVITTNHNIYEDIISHVLEDGNYGAAHRRWAFIRYLDTWTSAHPELFEHGQTSIAAHLQEIYGHRLVNHELMNAMVGCALCFSGHQYVTEDYIVPYYTHCLQTFSCTFFGYIMLTNIQYFHSLVKNVMHSYSTGTDKDCFDTQQIVNKEFEKLARAAAEQLLWCVPGSDEITAILNDEDSAFYFRCLKFTLTPSVRNALDTRSGPILKDFFQTRIIENDSDLYIKLYQQLQQNQLECTGEVLYENQEMDDNTFGGVYNQEMDSMFMAKNPSDNVDLAEAFCK